MPLLSAFEQFEEIVADPRFRGWRQVGEYRLGEKIPFFGQVLHYQLQTGNGVEEYASILRTFGWVVVFAVTKDNKVITNIQWKPGINGVEWGLSPGGIGKVPPSTPLEVVLEKTRRVFLNETGYGGGEWIYLDKVDIDSGKFRGTSPEDHGFPAHMYLAVDLEQQQEPTPLGNEIMAKLQVPLEEMWDILDERPRRFKETSCVNCAYAAMRELQKMGRV